MFFRLFNPKLNLVDFEKHFKEVQKYFYTSIFKNPTTKLEHQLDEEKLNKFLQVLKTGKQLNNTDTEHLFGMINRYYVTAMADYSNSTFIELNKNLMEAAIKSNIFKHKKIGPIAGQKYPIHDLLKNDLYLIENLPAIKMRIQAPSTLT